MMKRLIAVLLTAALIPTVLTGCSEPEADGSIPGAALKDPVSYVTDGALKTGKTAITVGDTTVSTEDFMYWLSYYTNYLSYQYYSMSNSTLNITDDYGDGTTVGQHLLDSAISTSVTYVTLEQKAAELGLTVSDEELEQIDSQFTDVTDQDYSVLYYATSVDALKHLYQQSYLSSSVQEQLFAAGGEYEPTEETMTDYAESNGYATCRYILFYTNDDSGAALEGTELESVQKQAQEVYKQLQSSKEGQLEADFAEMQRQYNYDGNTEPATYNASSSLVGGFYDALTGLKSGEMTMTEKTDYGYFIILRLDTDNSQLQGDYEDETFNTLVDEWQGQVEYTVSDAVTNLDMSAYYENITNIWNAIAENEAAEESASASAEPEAEAADTSAAASAEASGEASAEPETETADTSAAASAEASGEAAAESGSSSLE